MVSLSHRQSASTSKTAAASVGRSASIPLPDCATVVVVGGGPTGSFFAIRLLRRARECGRSARVIILEKKTEICFYKPAPFYSWEGCNYCAGGLSPRLTDILHQNHIEVPEEVVQSRPTEIVVHADWKNIELRVPPEREMLSVFRGSRPRQRDEPYASFDTFLLNLATDEGAEVITAEVNGVHYSAEGRPVIVYRTLVEAGTDLPDQTITADFAVFAGGVNRTPGMNVASDPVFEALRGIIPGLRPPRVRKAVIAEMQADEGELLPLDGEVHFMQYGSGDLRIAMASLVPKHDWITVVLMGKSIDRAKPAEYLQLVERFIELPNVRRLFPVQVKLTAHCCCHPNMTIGAAKNPFGSRIALAGDLAVSRLYKDGLYAAYTTASALADCILDEGIDRASLARCYAPVVKRLHADNRYGRVVFWLGHWIFAHPALSRVFYQAVLIERHKTARHRRRLAPLIWRTASGDDSYRHILGAMLHPASLVTIVVGGVLMTVRNKATERLFGLDWKGIGRFATGTPLEEMEGMRRELAELQGMDPPSKAPHMERMFSIRIRASKAAIMKQLGGFGDADRRYLRPRLVQIRRTAGSSNEVGTVIRYHVVPAGPTFSVALETVTPERYLLYRILDGMGRGGILAFVIDEAKPGVNLLTVYVGFDFPRGRGLGRIRWWLERWLFPEYVHDVVWNHSLCELKSLAELDEAIPT
jgi:flavin-dependent dehydrogenase